MDKASDKPKRRKSCIAAGTVCLAIAAMFLCYAVFTMIYFLRSVAAPEADYDVYFIVYFIAAVFKGALRFLFLVFFVVFGCLGAAYIICFKNLISSDESKVQNGVSVSFGLSLTVGIITVLPIILSVCRIIAHGLENPNANNFISWSIPFTLSVLCIVFNRIAAKKCGKTEVKI